MHPPGTRGVRRRSSRLPLMSAAERELSWAAANNILLHLPQALVSMSCPILFVFISGNSKSVGGVTVSMVAFQAVDPGSTPGRRTQPFAFLPSKIFFFCSGKLKIWRMWAKYHQMSHGWSKYVISPKDKKFCRSAPSEDRTHDLEIMRLTRCLLRHRGGC